MWREGSIGVYRGRLGTTYCQGERGLECARMCMCVFSLYCAMEARAFG